MKGVLTFVALTSYCGACVFNIVNTSIHVLHFTEEYIYPRFNLEVTQFAAR